MPYMGLGVYPTSTALWMSLVLLLIMLNKDVNVTSDQLDIDVAGASDPVQGSQYTFGLVQIYPPKPCKPILMKGEKRTLLRV